MFKLSMWWKDAITKLFLLYCIFQFFVQFYSIYQVFTTVRNPLIPESLAYYASFGHMLLILFWAIGAYVYWRCLNKQSLLRNKFWMIPLLLIMMLVGHTIILLLSFEFNPFG